MVEGHALLLPSATELPDAGDHHVLAAALKTQAQTIVTENLRDFPAAILAPLGIEARPAMTAETMLRDMEARVLVATVGVLAPHAGSL